MRPHVRPRRTARLAIALLFLGSLAPPSPARMQAPDLQQVEVVSGLSLHDSFYDDLAVELSGDLGGRTGTYSGVDFYPYMALAESEVSQFNDGFQIAFQAALAALTALFPAIGGIISAIIDAFLLLGGAYCGGTTPGASVTLPQSRIFGICTLDADPLTWNPLPDASGHEILIDAAQVGVISQVVLTAFVGDDDGPCSSEEKADLAFVFEDLRYRGVVTFTPDGADVTVTLLGSLPGVVKEFDGSSSGTADSLWTTANQPIGGVNLQQQMAELATTVVAASLKTAIEKYWGAYLPHDPAPNLADWLMNLSGTKQSLRFVDNVVSGSVGAATYDPLFSDVPGHKLRTVLRNVHSGVIADEEEPVCADPTAFIPAHATLTPNFGVESASVQGVFHTSFKNFEHAVVGGIRAAVGLRATYKDGSPYVVDHLFTDLVPEGTGTLSFLLTDPASPLTDPENPIGAVPISSAQRSALLATPTGATTLGQVPLGSLRLRIAICEERKTLLPYALSPTDSDGTVTHEVLMQATIERLGVPVLTEYFDATFVGNLLLSKVPGGDSTELRTIRCYLSSLSGLYNGLDWTAVTSSTPFASAPVSLFLRALFGDHDTPTSQADKRAFYLIDGLVGGLIERSAHGMVVLPGLDVPAYTGPRLAYDVLAAQYYADEYVLGFEFSRPALCATISRWGQAPGLVNGNPSALPRNRTLVIEVDWSDVTPLTLGQRKNMRTNVTVSGTLDENPYTVVNPSRYDVAALITEYRPHVGNESRVVDMSGNRVGAFLPGGGRHWVAATPAGYGALRELCLSDLSFFRDVTVELCPYKDFQSQASCSLSYPIGPLAAQDGGAGAHHDDPLEDIYEALLFETQLSCKGGGDCDGTRVVVRWTAPLFHECEEDSFGKDRYTFELIEGTLRVPPTSYLFETQPGCIGSGGGTPGQGHLDH